MTLERNFNHPPQTTDTNQLELWRFHALFDQPLNGNTDVQPQKSQAEQRALYDKSAALLHQVEDYASTAHMNTLVAFSTPVAAIGARALLGSRVGWCVAGAMVGWNIYNQFKMGSEIKHLSADLTPDIQKNYKSLSQATSTLVDNSSLLGDIGVGLVATGLAMAAPRNGFSFAAVSECLGLAGYKHYWMAENENIRRANVEVADAAAHLGIARPTADSLLTHTVAPKLDERVTGQPTVKKTAAPESPAGPALGLHPNQPFTQNQPESFSDYLKNIGK